MGEFPRPVLYSTMRKVSQKPPTSVSTHSTPISSMLVLSIGVGNHVHSGTPECEVLFFVPTGADVLPVVFLLLSTCNVPSWMPLLPH